MDHCSDHSGCTADIGNLKESDRNQWDALKNMGDKIDKFSGRLNMILGGVAVAAISAFLTLITIFVTRPGI